MSLRVLSATILVLALVLGATRAAADPTPVCMDQNPCHLRMRDPSTLTTHDGSQYTLPPGHFYDEPTNQALDTELKRSHDQETRLTAENKSLKGSLDTWQPGWITLSVALLVGVAGGIGGYYYYEHR